MSGRDSDTVRCRRVPGRTTRGSDRSRAWNAAAGRSGRVHDKVVVVEQHPPCVEASELVEHLVRALVTTVRENIAITERTRSRTGNPAGSSGLRRQFRSPRRAPSRDRQTLELLLGAARSARVVARLAARGAPGDTLDRFERRSFLEARDQLRHCGRTFAPDDVGSVAERLVGQQVTCGPPTRPVPQRFGEVGEVVRVWRSGPRRGDPDEVGIETLFKVNRIEQFAGEGDVSRRRLGSCRSAGVRAVAGGEVIHVVASGRGSTSRTRIHALPRSIGPWSHTGRRGGLTSRGWEWPPLHESRPLWW